MESGGNSVAGARGSDVKRIARLDIAIVDPDEAVRTSLTALLVDDLKRVAHFDSAEDFLPTLPDASPACLIAEVYLPGISGIELIEALTEAGYDIPTILIATRADVAMAVRGIRAGAVEYFEKPFIDAKLRPRVRALIGRKR